MRTLLPRSGFFGRMGTYLAEMHPLPRRLATALLISTSVRSVLGRIHDVSVPWFSSYAVLSAFSVFALVLILRLMDELKDKEVDRALFPHRPLPSGRVLESDIVFALLVLLALYLPAHAWAGAAFWTAIAVLGYALLMFRWFFIPGMLRPRLLKTLATHTPIIPLLLLHLLALFCAEQRLAPRQIRWGSTLAMVTMLWALVFAWEIARKIRAAEEEDAYVTYSRLLGPRAAVLLAAGAQTAALAAGLILFGARGFSLAFAGLMVVAYFAALCAHARFLLDPRPRTARLAPFAELDLIGALVAGLLA
jgi:4-hydroxybenzoate polyprenyltransferase